MYQCKFRNFCDAVIDGNFEKVKELFDKSFFFIRSDHYIFSEKVNLITLAVSKSTNEILTFLLDEGGPIEDNHQIPIIFYAAEYACSKKFRTLLERGMNLNVKSINGETPLSLAIENNKREIIDMLSDNKV